MVSAYLGPRQVPVYLAASVPEVDIDPVAMWRVPCRSWRTVRTARPARRSGCSGASRWSPWTTLCLLTTVSSAVYDSTIAINSVLQEVIRAAAERSSAARGIVDLSPGTCRNGCTSRWNSANTSER